MANTHYQEDESYFISMTDLMVGMLFIFIIMLMAFALNLKEQQSELKATTNKLTQVDETRVQMLKQIEQSLRERGVEVKVFPESGVLRLPEKLLFDSGKSELGETGRIAVARLAEVLSMILPCYSEAPAGANTTICPKTQGGRLEAIYIEGHTDIQRFRGLADGNWQLSGARAIEVYQKLVANSSLLGELRNDGATNAGKGQKLLGVSGYAEHRPVREEPTEEARRENRRIDLRFIMAAPSRADLDEIQKRIATPAKAVLP